MLEAALLVLVLVLVLAEPSALAEPLVLDPRPEVVPVLVELPEDERPGRRPLQGLPMGLRQLRSCR